MGEGQPASPAEGPDDTDQPPGDLPSTLVVTVGLNPAAAWMAILTHRPRHIVLLHTSGDAGPNTVGPRAEGSRPYADAISFTLERWVRETPPDQWPHGVTVSRAVWTSSGRDAEQIAATWDGTIRGLRGRPWLLDATGATKAMSVYAAMRHAEQFPDHPEWRSYVSNAQLLFDSGDRLPVDTSLLTVDQLARIHGFRIVGGRRLEAGQRRLHRPPEYDGWDRDHQVGWDLEARVAKLLLGGEHPGGLDEVWHGLTVMRAQDYRAGDEHRSRKQRSRDRKDFAEFDFVIRIGVELYVIEVKSAQWRGHRSFGWRIVTSSLLFGDHTNVVLTYADGDRTPYDPGMLPDGMRKIEEVPVEGLVGRIVTLHQEFVDKQVRARPWTTEPLAASARGALRGLAAAPYQSEVLVATEAPTFSAARTAAELCPNLKKLVLVATHQFLAPAEQPVVEYAASRGLQVSVDRSDNRSAADLTLLIEEAAEGYASVHVDATGGIKQASQHIAVAADHLGVPLVVMDPTQGRIDGLGWPDWTLAPAPLSPRLPEGDYVQVEARDLVGLLRDTRIKHHDGAALLELIGLLQDHGALEGQRVRWFRDTLSLPEPGRRSVKPWRAPVIAVVGHRVVPLVALCPDGAQQNPELHKRSPFCERIFPVISMAQREFRGAGIVLVAVPPEGLEIAEEAWSTRMRGIPAVESAVRLVQLHGEAGTSVLTLEQAVRSMGVRWE